VPTLTKVGQLRHGILGLRDAFAESFALLALVLASSLATSAAAANAGAAAPLVYVLAGAASLCLASVIIRFTRRMATAGGVYTYTSRGLSRNAGFISGWLYTWGFAAGISFVLMISAVYLSTVLKVHAGIGLNWFPAFLILLAILTVLALVDIRVATRIQLVLAALGASAVLLLILIILAKGGDAGINLQPFNPHRLLGVHGFFLATVFAFTGFIGFEAASVLGEEASEPLKSIPRAILAAVLTGLVFFVLLTWAMSLGFGVDHAAAWGKDPTALDTLATRYAGNWLAVIVDVAVVIDSFVAALAGVALVSRTSFAMGRDGGLPRAFAWTHPRFKTPWVSIIASLVLTLGLTLWGARIQYDPFTYFFFMGTTASLGILFVYILIALAGMVYFWRQRGTHDIAYNVVLDIVLPVFAIAICALTIYWSCVPTPPHPISMAPYIAGIWTLIGVAILVWLNVRSPEKVQRFGQLLGEEATGEPADVGAVPQQAT
jgi:amino acid transporter